MTSLYEEQIERLQLENDLLSLDSSHMEETDDWDTEVTYNRLNYLTAPTNSAPSNDTHDTFNQQFEHCPNSDHLSTDQRLPCGISHHIHDVIHDSNSNRNGSQHYENLTIPLSPIT